MQKAVLNICTSTCSLIDSVLVFCFIFGYIPNGVNGVDGNGDGDLGRDQVFESITGRYDGILSL